MKPVLVCCLVAVLTAGCVTNGPLWNTPSAGGSLIGAAAAPDPSPPVTFPTPPQPPPNFGPQLIIPATGGPPVMALPLGGALYQPVTGESPVMGTPLFP